MLAGKENVCHPERIQEAISPSASVSPHRNLAILLMVGDDPLFLLIILSAFLKYSYLGYSLYPLFRYLKYRFLCWDIRLKLFVCISLYMNHILFHRKRSSFWIASMALRRPLTTSVNACSRLSQEVIGFAPVGSACNAPRRVVSQPGVGLRRMGITRASPVACRVIAHCISLLQQ